MSGSVPPDPPAKPAAPPRRYALEVDLKQPPPPPPKDDAPFEWTQRRLIVLSLLALLFLVCFYAALELNGHPVATVLAVFPQIGITGGVIVSVLGSGSHVDPSAWSKQVATSLSYFAEKHTLAAGVIIVLLMFPVAWIARSMVPVDVQCPSGFRLRYGVIQDEIACDVTNEQIWAPFGLDRALQSAWCVPPDGHGWSALDRHDAHYVSHSTYEWIFGARDDWRHREITCYEDGGTVIRPEVEDVAFRYLEYGFASRNADDVSAPCAHLDVGIYEYDAGQNTCTRLGGVEELDHLFEHAYANDRTRFASADVHDVPAAPSIVSLSDDEREQRWRALGLLVSAVCVGCRGPEGHDDDGGHDDASPAEVDASPRDTSGAELAPDDGERDSTLHALGLDSTR